MVTKKELILKSGLELFATEGYTATSTNKIAQKAGVSESLIFRHFYNKEGLLKAIFEEGEQAFKALYSNIIEEKDPMMVVAKTIELPLDLATEHHEFWRLQFRLKWELQHMNPDKTKPLIEKLTEAFAKLNYKSPAQEARFLSCYLEGLASQTLLGGAFDEKETKAFLFSKYNLV